MIVAIAFFVLGAVVFGIAWIFRESLFALQDDLGEPSVVVSTPTGAYRGTKRVRDELSRAGAEVWEVRDDRCVVICKLAVFVCFTGGARIEILWAPDGSAWEARPGPDPSELWRLWRARPRTMAALHRAHELGRRRFNKGGA